MTVIMKEFLINTKFIFKNSKQTETIIPMARSFNKYQLEVQSQNLSGKASNIQDVRSITRDGSVIYPVISNPMNVPGKSSNDNKNDK